MTTATNVLRKRKWPLWLVWVLVICLLAGLGWFVYDRLTFRPTGEVAYECFPGICIVNVQTGWVTQVAKSGYSPTWSPDGQYLAYLISVNNQSSIQIYNYLSASISVLLSIDPSKTRVRQIIWSPNGQTMLLEASFSDGKGLYILELNGITPLNTPRLLATKELVSGYRSAFSPDGTEVYFFDYDELDPDGSAMYRINIETMEKQAMRFPCFQIAIQPTGMRVLCLENIREYFDFDIAEWNNGVDTETKTNWSISLSGIKQPSWSPNGQYIVYSQTFWLGFLGDHNGELWIMNADGSHPAKLTNGPNDRNPAWRPQP